MLDYQLLYHHWNDDGRKSFSALEQVDCCKVAVGFDWFVSPV